MRTRVGSNSLVRDLINLLRRSEGSGHLWRGGIKLPFRRPLPPVAEGSPKPGRSLGQLWLQPRKVSFLNTHCPSAKGVTTAQPGEGGSLWPAPCVSLRSEQRQALSSGLLRAGTWCWACIFRSVLRLPSEFQAPLCKGAFHTSSSGVGVTVVEQCSCAEGPLSSHPQFCRNSPRAKSGVS